MKYQKTVNLDNIKDYSSLQRGQWVTSGGAKGVWIGQKTNGVLVVMWHGGIVKANRSKLEKLINFLLD